MKYFLTNEIPGAHYEYYDNYNFEDLCNNHTF